MKNITKFLLILFISSLSFQSLAQTFGIRGGLNLANMTVKDDDGTYSDEFKMNPGFHIGGTVEFPFSEIVALETGLFLNTKGFKMDAEEEGIKVESKANLFYLDVPVTIKASANISDDVKIYGIAGPYVGFGLSGKIKGETSMEGNDSYFDEYDISLDDYNVSVDEDIKWGSGEEDDLKRLDFGLTFGAGVEFKGIQVGASYDLGLANVSAITDYGTTASHRIFKISVGYKFGD